MTTVMYHLDDLLISKREKSRIYHFQEIGCAIQCVYNLVHYIVKDKKSNTIKNNFHTNITFTKGKKKKVHTCNLEPLIVSELVEIISAKSDSISRLGNSAGPSCKSKKDKSYFNAVKSRSPG